MVSYNTVINALGRCGRVQEAMEHLHAMKEQQLSPDVVTFGTLIHACAQSAKKDAALALFAEMVGEMGGVVVFCGWVMAVQHASDEGVLMTTIVAMTVLMWTMMSRTTMMVTMAVLMDDGAFSRLPTVTVFLL